ncbi:MAG: AAA family ATPase [bacterium]
MYILYLSFHHFISLSFLLMFIIGLTGTLGSGKGTVVDYLTQKYHFEHLSATVFITEEIIRRNLPVDRDNMRIVADDLRRIYGP